MVKRGKRGDGLAMSHVSTYNVGEMETLNSEFQRRCEIEVEKRRGILRIPDGPLEFVYGYGNASTGIMLIGEAPGKDEVRVGRPFVGKAGAILSEILEHTGFNRDDLYITNVIKYRLSREGKRPGTVANRPATTYEITNSMLWLIGEILLIRPKLILTLGNVPLKAMRHIAEYFRTSETGSELQELQKSYYDEYLHMSEIGSCHGKRLQCSFKNFTAVHIPLYHPASLIYNRNLRKAYDADMKEVQQCVTSLLL